MFSARGLHARIHTTRPSAGKGYSDLRVIEEALGDLEGRMLGTRFQPRGIDLGRDKVKAQAQCAVCHPGS